MEGSMQFIIDHLIHTFLVESEYELVPNFDNRWAACSTSCLNHPLMSTCINSYVVQIEVNAFV